MYRVAYLLSFLAAAASAQKAGTLKVEDHPSLPIQHCSEEAGCTTLDTKIVIDANWRWLHSTKDTTNCYTDSTWDPELCPDGATCAANCEIEGADYSGIYGITTSGNSLRMNLVTNTNVGSRVYLMDTDSTYMLFKLKGQEFSFDVDVSNVPCGVNGALYFSEMEADGGMSAHPSNEAGAKFGTGYCDAQCPRDIKFIDGVANSEEWSSTSPKMGTGKFGSCCSELDVWEANKMSTALTPHTCNVAGQTKCSGADCGASSDSRYGGLCDPDGCDFNPYRLGNDSFYGPGKVVDTTRRFTVVTQFITDDGSPTGTLSKIARFYIQDGEVIPNSVTDVVGIDPTNAISDNFCAQEKATFDDTNSFAAHGGMSAMSASMDRGQVLVLSIWDDHMENMLWLDSNFTREGQNDKSTGAERGACSTSSGNPADIEAYGANSYVAYSNIKICPIGYSVNTTTTPPAGPSETPSSTPAGSSTVPHTSYSPMTSSSIRPNSSTAPLASSSTVPYVVQANSSRTTSTTGLPSAPHSYYVPSGAVTTSPVSSSTIPYVVQANSSRTTSTTGLPSAPHIYYVPSGAVTTSPVSSSTIPYVVQANSSRTTSTTGLPSAPHSYYVPSGAVTTSPVSSSTIPYVVQANSSRTTSTTGLPSAPHIYYVPSGAVTTSPVSSSTIPYVVQANSSRTTSTTELPSAPHIYYVPSGAVTTSPVSSSTIPYVVQANSSQTTSTTELPSAPHIYYVPSNAMTTSSSVPVNTSTIPFSETTTTPSSPHHPYHPHKNHSESTSVSTTIPYPVQASSSQNTTSTGLSSTPYNFYGPPGAQTTSSSAPANTSMPPYEIPVTPSETLSTTSSSVNQPHDHHHHSTTSTTPQAGTPTTTLSSAPQNYYAPPNTSMTTTTTSSTSSMSSPIPSSTQLY